LRAIQREFFFELRYPIVNIGRFKTSPVYRLKQSYHITQLNSEYQSLKQMSCNPSLFSKPDVMRNNRI